MSSISHYRLKERACSRLVLASILLTTLVNCGQDGSAANAPAPANAQVEMLDQVALEELRASFLEVSGSDRVAFASGSAELTPKAQFQLERQALWLSKYDFVAIRFRSESMSAKGVEERRLALRRAEAVQAYLMDYGVKAGQFVGVDVEYGLAGTVTTLIDPFHFGETAARQASSEVGQPRS